MNYLPNPQQNASSHQEEGEFDSTDHHNGNGAEGVHETMTNVEFFLRTFGSTRAVRDKLRIQKLKIVGLRRTLDWCQRKQRTDNDVALVPPAEAKGKVVRTPVQTEILQVGQRPASEQSAPPPAVFSTHPTQVDVIELGVSGRASGKRKRNLCKEPGCTKLGRFDGEKKGCCFRHGGGQTCSEPGCTRARLVKVYAVPMEAITSARWTDVPSASTAAATATHTNANMRRRRAMDRVHLP